MKKNRIVFIFLIAIYGCRKDAISIHPDLEGTWNTSDYNTWSGILTTISSKNSTWMEQPQHSSNNGQNGQSYSGDAKIKDDELTIGTSHFKVKTHIDAYPAYDDDGNYFMILTGKKLYGAFNLSNATATVSGDTVIFSWLKTANIDADFDDGEVLDYRTQSSSDWQTITFTNDKDYNNPFAPKQGKLTGLLPATIYEWRIKSVRGNHSSQYSAVQTFTTQ